MIKIYHIINRAQGRKNKDFVTLTKSLLKNRTADISYIICEKKYIKNASLHQ